MKKVFILLGFALLGGGAFGEVLSNGPLNGNAYTCPVYSCVPISSIEMVFVKGGTLANHNGGAPIEVGDFYIGKYEVTQKLWRDVMGSYPGTAPSAMYGEGDDYPMYYVSWDDAQKFIDSLNVLYGNGKFRLPTEAEWEYAARGGDPQQGYKYAGSNNLDSVGWYWDHPHMGSSKKSHPVGELAPNGIGAYDMSGNVWEWCQDYFGGSSGESAIPTFTPDDGSSRVLRGGGWGYAAQYCTVSFRNGNRPGYHGDYHGFRLACSSNP